MASRKKIRAVAEISGIGISKVGKDVVFDAGSIAAAAAPKSSLVVVQDHFEIRSRQSCNNLFGGFVLYAVDGPIGAAGIGCTRWLSVPIHNNAVKATRNNVIHLVCYGCG